MAAPIPTPSLLHHFFIPTSCSYSRSPPGRRFRLKIQAFWGRARIRAACGDEEMVKKRWCGGRMHTEEKSWSDFASLLFCKSRFCVDLFTYTDLYKNYMYTTWAWLHIIVYQMIRRFGFEKPPCQTSIMNTS